MIGDGPLLAASASGTVILPVGTSGVYRNIPAYDPAEPEHLWITFTVVKADPQTLTVHARGIVQASPVTCWYCSSSQPAESGSACPGPFDVKDIIRENCGG